MARHGKNKKKKSSKSVSSADTSPKSDSEKDIVPLLDPPSLRTAEKLEDSDTGTVVEEEEIDEKENVSIDDDEDDEANIDPIVQNLNTLGSHHAPPLSPLTSTLGSPAGKSVPTSAPPAFNSMASLVHELTSTQPADDDMIKKATKDENILRSLLKSQDNKMQKLTDACLHLLRGGNLQNPFHGKKEENDRKPISSVNFSGDKGLLLFKEDVKTQCLHRSLWDTLLTVRPNANTTYFIPDDFLTMKEKTMERARRGRTGPEQIAARNMYVAIWSTLSGRVKTSIIEAKQLYKTDGPSLLYYILRKYTGKQTSVVRQTVQKVDLLGKYMNERFKYDVEAYCTYAHGLILRLREAGHKDSHLTEKIYEGLLQTPCKDFNQDMKVWRESYRLNNAIFSCDDVVSHARERYRHYKFSLSVWPTNNNNNRYKRKHGERTSGNNDRSDLTSLLSLKGKEKKKLIAMLSGNTSGGNTNPKNKKSHQKSNTGKYSGSPYSYSNHYGPDKEFSTKGELMGWLFTRPDNGQPVIKNGVTWHWCDHCEKLGSHTTDTCRYPNDKGKKRARTNAYSASVYNASNQNSDDGEDTSNPTYSSEDVDSDNGSVNGYSSDE